MYGMRGPREDPDDVIENPLKLGIIQANALAVGLLNAARSTRKLKIVAAAECDRALLERGCEADELKGLKWYESYNAILRDPDAITRVDAVFIGGNTGSRTPWAVAAAQHHKHVLIGCPAAADYESTVVMRDACVAEGVALMDVVPFSHHERTEQMLSTIAEARFFGEVRRIDVAFTISASRDFLEGAGKESTAKDDPLGCLGDLGWACARMGKLAYGVLNPVSAQVIHSEATAENVPVDITAVVYFGENSTKPCHLHCSYVHPLQQHFKIIGDNKVLRCEDFAYPRNTRDCAYTLETFPAGDEGRSALVDLGQTVVSALNTARCFNASPQRVAMLDQFADLCLLEDDSEWRRQGFEGKHQARELFSSQIIGTQAVVQALVESLRNPGKAIAVPEDTMPPPPPRDNRMRFD
jgi:predicted dehydrogenase